MSVKVVPYNFIQANIEATWQDIAWGYERGCADIDAVKSFATDRLLGGSADPREIELAGLLDSDLARASELMRTLLTSEGAQNEERLQKRWLYLQLAYLFENRGEPDNALGKVEEIYSDFDYPAEIASFVRYMPTEDGYDPKAHTHAENLDRLISNWRSYLEQERQMMTEASS